MRIPYSAIFVLFALALSCPLNISFTAGLCAELLILVILMTAMHFNTEFEYDTIVGKLMTQYSAEPTISNSDIYLAIFFRSTAYLLAVFAFLMYIPSIILFGFTCIFYKKTNT